MISTFDLMLLGCLVSGGGLAFLRQGKSPRVGLRWLSIGKRPGALTSEGLEHHARSAAVAGARWLTVGALTLFIAYAHGAKEGYLFGPWTDVLFHFVFVAGSWSLTALRMQQAAERATTVSLPTTLPSSTTASAPTGIP